MCVRVYVLFVVVVVIVCVCDKRSRKADAYCNSPQIVKHYYIIRGKQKKKTQWMVWKEMAVAKKEIN